MIEVKLPHTCTYKDFFEIVTPWLKEQDIKYTYFSGKNVIAFENDDDSSMFILKFGGTKGYFLDELKQQFKREMDEKRWRRG